MAATEKRQLPKGRNLQMVTHIEIRASFVEPLREWIRLLEANLVGGGVNRVTIRVQRGKRESARELVCHLRDQSVEAGVNIR